jgi:hypothetical protein
MTGGIRPHRGETKSEFGDAPLATAMTIKRTICDADWKSTEFIDPNHVMKSYDRKYHKDNQGKVLIRVGNKLKQMFQFLVWSQFSEGKKQKHWSNTVNHDQGNHSNCPAYAQTKQ